MAMLTRLSDPAIGFNAAYAAIQGSYGTPAITINWDASINASPRNFTFGDVPPDLLEQSSPFEYPLLTIDAVRGPQRGYGQRIKNTQFDGVVTCIVKVHLGWVESEAVDFETWPAAVIDAMFNSINGVNQPASWGTGITFNRDLDYAKGQIVAAGDNWRRTVQFVSQFYVIA